MNLYPEHEAKWLFSPHVFFSSFLIVSLMSALKVRKDCRYSELELTQIISYKLDFISSSTQERITMLQRDILPKLFNYWQDLGKVYNKSESKILAKVCREKVIGPGNQINS